MQDGLTLDVAQMLLDLYDSDPGNHFEDPALGPLFDPPLVGAADADDPWFERFKELIGDFHWTPQEALALVAPEARARSVICWALPKGRTARADNARETEAPARTWAYVRTFGEQMLDRMRNGLAERLRALGYAAIPPAIAPENTWADRPRVGLSTCWSERHVAMVAGLGTFGLSGGLITVRGIAHRAGSVVTDAEIAPTPRPYGDDPFAWCLRLSRGTCGACAQRCPAGSIGETLEARDKEACRRHGAAIHASRRALFGWEGVYGCGLCQTRVPCEARNPTAAGGEP
jgi:epoxyqueuosine reductase QueG